jgi:sigma-54 dependent transcriptional regulator, acetoin dehydrogenase operon transcriptional activator AcoR
MKTESRRGTEPAIPANPGRSSKEVVRAWERFMASGQLAGSTPRLAIAESWQRCRTLGVDPFLERAPTVVTPEEIEAILARDDLGRAGKQVLDEFSRAVQGTGHVILLADAQGRIVYSVGHRAIQDVLDHLNLSPGGGWSESAVGSNGIGTPIALGRPEAVFGPEHYCQRWQPWVCYGCPVRDPASGSVVGGVDITGPARKADPMTFVLTVSIARSIERLLVVFELERRHALLATFRGLERKWPADGLLAVDGRGRVVEMNSAGARAFGVRSAGTPDAALVDLSPELWTHIRHAIESEDARQETTVALPPAGERAMLCRIEPVTREGRREGSIIIVSDRWSSSGREPVSREMAVRDRSGAGVARRAGAPKYTFDDILGESPGLRTALSLARAGARGLQQRPILLIGESGTGKELVAHAIHAASRRANGRFVAVNCGALPGELVESELFGYASGAFTGARREGQTGKFEAAHGGTVFLDEIDSLPLELQGKFLRVVEEGEVVRLGSESPRSIDVRIVAACNVDLRQRVDEGKFRLDLAHRLSVVEIVLPPLRERGRDVLLLATAFLHDECAAAGTAPLTISPEAGECLLAYTWPGNIRELRNLCTRWALTVEGREIQVDDVPRHVREPVAATLAATSASGTLRGAEDAIIRRTLEAAGGDVGEAARRLGVAKTTIYRRLKHWSARGSPD